MQWCLLRYLVSSARLHSDALQLPIFQYWIWSLSFNSLKLHLISSFLPLLFIGIDDFHVFVSYLNSSTKIFLSLLFILPLKNLVFSWWYLRTLSVYYFKVWTILQNYFNEAAIASLLLYSHPFIVSQPLAQSSAYSRGDINAF